MKKVIWSQGEHEVEAENCKAHYGTKAMKAIAELVVEALQINWNERRIVNGLLISAIGNAVGELLEQYLHSQLEIIGGTLNRKFGIDEVINTGYATHAKMNDFIGAIKARDGTAGTTATN